MKKWKPANPIPRIRCPRTIKRLTSRVKTDPATGCWLWQGHLHTRGYGQIWYDGKTHQTHRVSFAIFNGELSCGITVDHTCHNPACCNPDHLAAKSLSDNCAMNQHCARYKQCQDDIPI